MLQRALKRTPLSKGPRSGQVRPLVRDVLGRPDLIRYDTGKIRGKSSKPVVLAGASLRVITWISHTPLGKFLFLSKGVKASNLDLLSGEYIPDQPTFYPSPPRPLVDHTTSNQNTLQKLVDRLLSAIDNSDPSRLHSCLDFHRVYKTKQCTPVGVAERIISAIHDSNNVRSPPLRAIVDHDPNVILAMAHASAERWKKDQPLSLIDGVPVAVKGEFNVAPYDFHGGTTFVPNAATMQPECALVTKMREAGAVIIGVANLQEFCAGVMGSNPNRLHGMARNPHNVQHYCGGSSSGSAASVAAGLCPIALGADAGGSTRIPAALCGVVGLKPMNQLLDTTGSLSLSPTLGVPGLLCSSVMDAAIAMMVLEGGQVLDLKELGQTGLAGIKVGMYRDFFEHGNREVIALCNRAVERMKELGAEVVDVKIAEIREAMIGHSVTVMAEFTSSVQNDMDKHFDKLNAESRLAVAYSAATNSVDYLNAGKQRTRSIAFFKDLFGKVDLLVTPTVACTAPLFVPAYSSDGMIDVKATAQLVRFCILANVTGIPGIALPVDLSKDGLPVSLQLMAPWYQEGKLLTVAYALEKAGLVAKRPKDCFYDVLAQS